MGPPLTQIARRTYLAGRLENTPGNMMRWTRTPRDIEPGAMPNTGVSEADARDVAALVAVRRGGP